jgi:FKBP-type peptidyl-prolyl cis-trans isomerase
LITRYSPIETSWRSGAPMGDCAAMRAPPRALLVSSFVLLVDVTACERAAAPPPPPAAAAPAPAASAAMSGAGVMTPPPADVSAPPADAERDANGVARKILARGTGTEHASVDKTYVELRYSGWERNGRQFEGTGAAEASRRFDPRELVEGLQLELPRMVVGDKRRVWIPAALAYGPRTNFVNAPKGDMTYEIELVGLIPLPPVPADVAAAPKDAKVTPSGLAYQVLEKGKGKKHPSEESHANVVYAAWTPAGKMFQSSYLVGDTMRVKVKRLPPGWREAMLHMVEGDNWRLWLPGKLAFGDLPPGQEPLPFGPPPGPVVFEVQLVHILE